MYEFVKRNFQYLVNTFALILIIVLGTDVQAQYQPQLRSGYVFVPQPASHVEDPVQDKNPVVEIKQEVKPQEDTPTEVSEERKKYEASVNARKNSQKYYEQFKNVDRKLYKGFPEYFDTDNPEKDYAEFKNSIKQWSEANPEQAIQLGLNNDLNNNKVSQEQLNREKAIRLKHMEN